MTLRIKACGLNEVDKTSLKSMLNLAADLLSHEWQLSDESNAELHVYCFDYPEGEAAWQNRSTNVFNALLTSHGNVTEAVDIIIKKPLRTANFSEALNLIDDKVRGPQTAKVKQNISAPPAKTTEAKPSKLRQWSNTVQQQFLSLKKPASDLPQLNLAIEPLAEQTSKNDTFTDPVLLNKWLQLLPEDPHQKISTLLSHLQSLNGLNLSVSKCLPLLEEYRQIFKPLIFERDTAMIRADNRQLTEKRKYLRQLQLSLHLLTQCYLRYAQQRFQRGKRPAEDPIYLLCLLRASELLGLQVVNAFQHYYQPPDKAIWQLHQIYLYLESAHCLKSVPEFKQPIEVTDFYTVYVRTLLTGIADPYNMPRFSVVKIFQLMGSLTNETDIDLMSEKQMHITSQFLLTGHFCINGQSDQLPLAMARTAVDIRSASDTRLLNVQPLLRRLDTIIKQQKNISAIERQVLTHAIPQLNGSYERQTERTTSFERRTVGVCYGLKAVHQMLSQEGKVNVQPWTLMNQGDEGLMLMRETADCRAIQIGDLIAFKETPEHNQLGIIRWLHIGPEQTRIGLSVLQGNASAEHCMPEGEMAEIPVISLNDDDKPSLLSQKGLFSPKRKIHLNTSEVQSLIGADQLLSSTLDYDYFSYKTLKIS